MPEAPEAQPKKLRSCNAYESTVVWTFYFKNYFAVASGEQSVVFTDAYVVAGMKLGAALANQNIACFNDLTAKTFYTQSLCMRVATVASTTACLLMSHFPTSLNYAEMPVIWTSV